MSYYLLEMPIRRGRLWQFRVTNRPLVIGVVGGMAALLAISFVTTTGGEAVPFYLQERAALTAGSGAGRGEPVVGIAGDSIANSFAPAFTKVAAKEHWATVNATFPGCPIGELMRVGLLYLTEEFSKTCVTKVPAAQKLLVTKYKPRVILWYSGRERYDVLKDGTVLKGGTADWKSLVYADWDRTLDRLRAGGAKVVLILPVFQVGTIPDRCHWPYDKATRCDPVGSIGAGRLRAYYLAWAAQHRGELRVLDVVDVLCPDSSRPCPALTASGVKVRTDGNHYSAQGAGWFTKRLVPLISEMDAR